ncbi:MAG: right-handed parallel beta-helix repeat-containing protein, partial [Pirellulales bacterium]
NKQQGIKITGPAATGNHIRGNAIGFDRQTGTVVANLDGVRLTEGASGNSIGGTQAGAENEIAHNTRIGVWIGGGTGNAVLHNSIHDNGELGLAIESRLVTANDADDADAGANNLQNFPEFGAVTLGDGSLNIAYSVPTTLDNSAFPLSVEFFAADSNDQEGQTFLGSHSYTAIGPATATVDAGPAGIGTRIVATATDALGNTSEFSAAATVASPLLAAGGAGGQASSTGQRQLTAAELMTTVDAAVLRLEEAGFSAELFSNVSWAIADLSGATLGLATPATVTIDADAAGYGWYIDATPQNDAEFAPSADRPGTAAEIDLLTVVMHELGHVAGLDDLYDADDEDDLMYAWLQPGMRKTSTSAAIADKVFDDL